MIPQCRRFLLDDVVQLDGAFVADPESLHRTRSLECAYSSLRGVSLLHVAAEYNSVNAARSLLARGVSVDVAAAVDEEGLGGQTPIFHSINSNQNNSRQVLEVLVEAGASLEICLKGMVWGGGSEWETVVYDVSPTSSAQCGLYFSVSPARVAGPCQSGVFTPEAMRSSAEGSKRTQLVFAGRKGVSTHYLAESNRRLQ
jgi:ankyrin repeat protein